MTIDEAVKDLLQSDAFKNALPAKPYLRNQLSRYNRGTLKEGSTIKLLLDFGYAIEVKKPRILKYKKTL